MKREARGGGGANRPKGFGMTSELARKKEAKFDAELANDALEWIKSVLVHAGRTDAANRINVVTSSGN